MDAAGLDEGKYPAFECTSMCLCCFPRLTQWLEGFQNLDVNDNGAGPCRRDGGQMAQYRDITQRFIEETNSMCLLGLL